MLNKEKGTDRVPKEKSKELEVKEDDTDNIIAFKEAMQFIVRIGGRKFC